MASSRNTKTAAYRRLYEELVVCRAAGDESLAVLCPSTDPARSHSMERFTSRSAIPAVNAPPTRATLPTAAATASANTGSTLTVRTSLRYNENRFILFEVSPILLSNSWSIAYTPANLFETSAD